MGGLLSAGHVGVETVRGTGAKARTVKPEPAAHPVDESGPVEAIRPTAPAPTLHLAMKAAKAVVDHHTLTEAVRLARDSVLRRQDPEQFQAYVAEVADAVQVPDLHMAPDALDAVLTTPEGQRVQAAIPDMADRVVAARDAGTDVPITADEYLTHVGPELHDQIAGDVRVGADAMTPAEAVADHQSRVTALQSTSVEAETNANDPEAFRQSRQDVIDAIRQQYHRETVGKLAPQQRVAAAELTGHAFAVEAAEQGVEPMERYQQRSEDWTNGPPTRSAPYSPTVGRNEPIAPDGVEGTTSNNERPEQKNQNSLYTENKAVVPTASISMPSEQNKNGIIQRGGAHKEVRGIGGYEAHHMPANSISPLSIGEGPSIAMLIGDHSKTKSWGNSKAARAYRQAQAKLIQQGNFREAQQMDIDDIMKKFGERYNKAIQQMLKYSESKGY